MHRMWGMLLVAVLLGAHGGFAQAHQRTVHFRTQDDEATVAGTVEGEEVVQYKVPAKVGQFLLVGGHAKSARVSFWVRDPGGAEVYNSQVENAAYVARPERDGTYVVGVFMRRVDAARGHAAFFRLRFSRKALSEG